MRISLAEIPSSVFWQEDEIGVDGVPPIFFGVKVGTVRLSALVLLFTGVNLKVFWVILLFFPAVTI